MPSWAHQSVLSWLIICRDIWSEANLLEIPEKRDLIFLASPNVDLLNPIPNPPPARLTRHKKKEPDTATICIRAPPSAPGKSAVPSILVEAGYSQSYKSLVENARKILIGGAPAVQLVMIVKFFKRKLGVAVRLEFWRRDLAGTPYLAETHHVFPIPLTHQSPIFFTREELFGTGFVFPPRNLQDRFHLDINELRRLATIFLSHAGLIPHP
ncbi:hypothetical protein N7495_002623 [Penicillium taxi]|uniref:uncharacterized protein n=1 Tax=Penicillium taxi TaxID=168475 RepID=UPI00254544D8|nr:uncharacterized protein N7495_002623 [Penicillium taxi]KAJ5902095.1 hypothetical protein N7495_002623 [Penicillium taxi]